MISHRPKWRGDEQGGGGQGGGGQEPPPYPARAAIALLEERQRHVQDLTRLNVASHAAEEQKALADVVSVMQRLRAGHPAGAVVSAGRARHGFSAPSA